MEVWDLGFRVWDLGGRSFGFRVLGFRVEVLCRLGYDTDSCSSTASAPFF